MLGGLCKLWLFIAIFNFGIAGKRRALKVFSSALPIAEILLESSAQDFRGRRGGGFERLFLGGVSRRMCIAESRIALIAFLKRAGLRFS